MQDRVLNQSSAVDTWWRSIRSGTKRLFFQAQQEREESALKSALTSRVNENKFVVVDELKLDEIKTKKFVEGYEELKG